MNKETIQITNLLEKIKDFIIHKGSSKLINTIKPILMSLIANVRDNNLNDLKSEEYENFIKFLEHLHNQGFILPSDENKLLSLIPKEIKVSENQKNNPNKESKYLDNEKIELKALHQTLNNLKNDLQTTENKNKEAYEVFQNTLEKVNEKHLNALNEFKNYKKALEEDSKLLAAKDYWADKAQRHSTSATWSFYMFLFPVSLLVFLIFYITQKSSLAIQLDNNQTLSATTSLIHDSNSLLHYLPYLLIFSLLIWVSRIFLKIMFSNLHLKEEALEKETQIMTYLTLIKEGAGLENDDRKLILEAIFRPSTNGLIKDESNVTLLDIANIFKGK